MCCKNFWSKTIPFALTFALGISIANYFQKQVVVDVKQNNLNYENNSVSKFGFGKSGGDKGNSIDTYNADLSSRNKSVTILSNPRPAYTDDARQNGIQGTVTLRVTFQANSEIGNIVTINSLPDGLTEQAISAAKQIKFKAAKKDDIPVTVTKQVQYNFILY